MEILLNFFGLVFFIICIMLDCYSIVRERKFMFEDKRWYDWMILVEN